MRFPPQGAATGAARTAGVIPLNSGRMPVRGRPGSVRLRYFLRFFSRCERALPAADFDALPVRLSRSTFDALLAAFFPVTFRPPLLFAMEVIYPRLSSLASINWPTRLG